MSSPVDRRRQADDHRHLQARHRPRYRPGAGAEPRRGRRCRACPRRCSGSASPSQEDLARPPDGRPPVLARQVARPAATCPTTRLLAGHGPALAVSTASATCSCSAAATTRCASGSIPDKRRRAQPDRRRHRRRAAARRTCRSPPARSASRRSNGRRLPAQRRDAGPADRSGAVRRHRHQDRRRRAASRASATSPGSSSARQDYGSNAYLDRPTPTAILAIFQQPGSNALAAAAGGQRRDGDADEAISRRASTTTIVYNPTEFISQSVDEVCKTLFEAIVLVVVVVLVFLQTWRAASSRSSPSRSR